MENDRKWIYLSYVIIIAITAWVLHKIGVLVLDVARVPNTRVLEVMPLSGLIGITIASLAGGITFRREKVRLFSEEVLQELKKVTWPIKKTAYTSTMVVVVLVMIASVILGFYDWVTTKIINFLLQT